MKKYSVLFLSFILIICCFSTCIKKDNFDLENWDREIKYDAGFAIPLAFGDLSYVDAEKLAGGEIKNLIADENGRLSLVYNTVITSDVAQKKLKLKNQEYNLQFNSSSSTAISSNINTSLQWEFTTDFNPEAKFKKIIVKEGTCSASFGTSDPDYHGTINGYILFPSISAEGGAKLSYTFTNRQVSNSMQNIDNPISLTNYQIEFPENNNKIPIDIYINFGSSPLPSDLNFYISITGPSDNSDEKGNGITFKEAWGYFGVNTLIYKKDSVDIKIFKKEEFEIERYWFEDPKIHVKYTNSYGIPTDFQFLEVKTFDNNGAEIYPQVSMFGSHNLLAPNWTSLAHPLYPIIYEHGELYANTTNSNFREIIANRPRWLQIIAQVETNKNTSPAQAEARTDYISDTSKIKLDIKVEMPLWGDLYHFIYQKTTDFELPEIITKYDPIKQACLRIDITNGFPAEMISQIYFLREDETIIDSLLDDKTKMLLKAASVESDGMIREASRKISNVIVTQKQIQNWKDVKKIKYKAWANTTDADPYTVNQKIKVYDDYRIKFNIGFDCDIAIEGNIDSILNTIDSL